MKSPRSLIALLVLSAMPPTLWADTNTFPASGNVGIGTTSPSNALHIKGASGDNVPLLVESQTTNAYISLKNTAGDNSLSVSGSTLYLGGSGTSGTIAFRNGWDTNMVLTGAGNVGVGTTSPLSRLDVVGDGTNDTVAILRSRKANAYFALVAGASDDASGEFSFERTGSNSGNIYIGGSATGNIVMRSGGYNYRMIVTSDGNVGIGTGAPSHKLSVSGTIRAKEVIVDTGWSDYVFAPDYRLAPLSEVERHIKAEGHLPGIPSAQEVADHGVSMGEMQSKLLAKIEELTLHVIAQQKQLAAQSARIERLEAEKLQPSTR